MCFFCFLLMASFFFFFPPPTGSSPFSLPSEDGQPRGDFCCDGCRGRWAHVGPRDLPICQERDFWEQPEHQDDERVLSGRVLCRVPAGACLPFLDLPFGHAGLLLNAHSASPLFVRQEEMNVQWASLIDRPVVLIRSPCPFLPFLPLLLLLLSFLPLPFPLSLPRLLFFSFSFFPLLFFPPFSFRIAGCTAVRAAR
jgi:hypothetical protein